MDDFLRQSVAPFAERFGLPSGLLALLILLAFGLLAHWLLRRIARRMAAAADTTKGHWDDVLFHAITPPAEWALWLGVLLLGLGLFEPLAGLRAALGKVAPLAFVTLVGWLLHRMSAGVEREMLAARRGPIQSDDRATINAVALLFRVAVWIAALLMALQSLGVSISGLLAIGGIGGIAVGFAAKDLLANFFGGLSIHLDRPFAVGDWIRSPDRAIEGTVEQVGLRVTRIRTFDQRPLYVPNSAFSSIALENPSRMNNRRIYEYVGIRYGDASKMAAIVSSVRAMLVEHPEIEPAKTLIVNFDRMGPSSLDFFVYVFTKTTNWIKFHAIKEDVLLRILAIVEEHGAEVAFPTRELIYRNALPEPEPPAPTQPRQPGP